MRYRQWIPAGLLVVGLVAAACGSQGGGSAGNSASPAVSGQATGGTGSAVLKIEKTSVGTVLANAQGRTLYWFVIDTPTTSNCTGSCLSAWPAVRGMPRAESSVTVPGKLGDIKRPDGITQATWNGHPLYTYSGDSAPGQANGDGINSFGGLWHAVVVSGSGGSSPSPSSGGGGGGGY